MRALLAAIIANPRGHSIIPRTEDHPLVIRRRGSRGGEDSSRRMGGLRLQQRRASAQPADARHPGHGKLWRLDAGVVSNPDGVPVVVI